MAEVMQAEQKCGCAIRAEYGSILEDSNDVLTFKGIAFCPMHKAAEAMLEALRLILDGEMVSHEHLTHLVAQARGQETK